MQDEHLFNSSNKLLVAVSGGPDSMVLLELLSKLGQTMEIAHVNFQLRGAESEAETQFLIDFCEENKLKLHIKYANTQAFMKINAVGIQEAARNIRYQWFEEIRKERQLHAIALAHHANDQIETMLFHLLRGAGSKGLAGMQPKSNFLIRPLLFASRVDILKFAAENNIPYCTDSSNLKDDYARNYIRNQIIPQFENIEKSYLTNITHTGKIMAATHYYFKAQIAAISNELQIQYLDRTEIDLNKLTDKPYSEFVLFELLKPYEFNFVQCKEILQAFSNSKTGATFNAGIYRALVNRDILILSANKKANETFEISALPQTLITTDALYEFSIAEFEGFKENIFWLDADLICLPLKLRNTNVGDKFIPLGLPHFQKVSDYLINKKVNRFDKENVLVVLNGNEICALLPFQISDKFKVNSSTRNYLKIEIKKGPTK